MKTVEPEAVGPAEDPATRLNRLESGDEERHETERPSTESERRPEPKSTKPPHKAARTRRKLAKGIYKDRYGVAATVKVDGIQRERRFARGTAIKTMRTWQDTTRASLRSMPKGAKHTLAYDAPRYLRQVEHQLASIRDRRRHLNLWLTKFGSYLTLSLERHLPELNAQLYEWRETLSGSSCNHRRDALMNLVRRLYGGSAAAGLSDLVTFPKPPPRIRAVSRVHLAAVLAQIGPGTVLAARLQLMSWTGMRPAQMGLLTPEHFVLDHEVQMPHVIVPRAKGGKEALIPLLEEGIAAAREFMRLEAYGAWRTGKPNKALAVAARKAGQEPFTVYQIRHSFASALRESGADVADIQYMYGHTNPNTTIIYAPRVMKKNRKAIERIRAAEKPRRETGEDVIDISKTGSLPAGRAGPCQGADLRQVRPVGRGAQREPRGEQQQEPPGRSAAAGVGAVLGSEGQAVAMSDLDVAYREQLEAKLARPRTPWEAPWQTRAMLAWMETHPGGRLAADDVGRAWVWSDLHLDHRDIVWQFSRPFQTLDEMRRTLLEAWRQTVDEGDLVICAGDVTVGAPSRVIDEELAGLSGEKLLVVGNHEFVNNLADPKGYGFEAAYPTLVCDSDPPLLLTHEPLETVPAGAVNVHGHLHGTHARSAARQSRRHLNVNVELLSYRPVRLAELAAAARVLVAGGVEPQQTTMRTIELAARKAVAARRRTALYKE